MEIGWFFHIGRSAFCCGVVLWLRAILEVRANPCLAISNYYSLEAQTSRPGLHVLKRYVPGEQVCDHQDTEAVVGG